MTDDVYPKKSIHKRSYITYGSSELSLYEVGDLRLSANHNAKR